MRELSWPDVPSLFADAPRDTCFCVGSGPSLDTVDLNRLAGRVVLCANAAAVYVYRSACRATAWWVANNQNAIEQSADLVPPPWRVICLERVREQIERHATKVDTVLYYSKKQHFPRHTTMETILRVAELAGFRRAVLLGVDCDPTAKEVYARDCRHANCIYEEQGKRAEYMARFVTAIEDIARTSAVEIVSTSPSFPHGVIPYAAWENFSVCASS